MTPSHGQYFTYLSNATLLPSIRLHLQLLYTIDLDMVDWLSLAVPLAYLGILIGSLATFSSLYRKRKAGT